MQLSSIAPLDLIFHLLATFLNVLVVALCLSYLYCVLETRCTFDLSCKYLETLSHLWVFMSLPAIAKVYSRSAPCRSWLLYACISFLWDWNGNILYDDMLNLFRSIHEKNWRQNRMRRFFSSLTGSLVWLWSWSLPVLRCAIIADWDSRERKKPNRLQNVWPLGQWGEWVLSQRVNPACSQSLVENQVHREGIYKYFSLSTPDYFYWQLERKTSPYISVSLYENSDSLYSGMIAVTGWLSGLSKSLCFD